VRFLLDALTGELNVLKYKLFKWFAGLVIVFGTLSALLGIWIINRRVVQEAQTRVRYDLSSAWAVYQSKSHDMETVVRLLATRTPLIEACAAQKWSDRGIWEPIQGILGKAGLDFDLDFAAIVAGDGKVVARGCAPYRTGDYRPADPIIAKALTGAATSGAVLLSRQELACEGEGLVNRAFVTFEETPRARATPRTDEDRGMVMIAAAPILDNGRVVGAIYAGVLLNRNEALVDHIQNVVFGQDSYRGKSLGTVTVFLEDTRIATTVRFANGNRAIGTRVSKEVADRVLDNGARWADRAFVVQDWYLTAYDPIRDPRGAVIGMLYVGTLESPFRDMSRAMILQYTVLVAISLVAALLMAMFIAGRLAKPLHRLAESANKMRQGHAFQRVPADGSCVETASLIQSFNDMASALGERENQLKEANEHLEGTNESLKATNAQYMETLQFVSHELNSPISAIMNYVYMLRQRLLGELSDKQMSAVEVMAANLKRVMEMIRHYLNLARIETGEMEPTPTRFAAREDVISPILASLDADIHAKNLRVEDLVGPKIMLHADLNMTREVFENLISNAVKYGRPGGLITLNCRQNGAWAEFFVRNEGEGIPPERRSELFQKFSRIELGEPKKSSRGTGLGLFISKKIVESHGGTISAESEPGRWTEFRCTLPLSRDSDHPPVHAQSAAPAKA
jgi:two-component system NtrC family sensor kinase